MWQDVKVGVRGYTVWCQIYKIFTIYTIMWIESASDIYILSFILFRNFTIL